MPDYLIYGANGYTGSLIARMAAARGERPVLAGRNGPAVTRLAAELGLPARTFDVDDPARLDAGLSGIPVILNCAGPFTRTAGPVVDACLRSRTHYLDITGEIAVFETLAARDAEARAGGVTVMPGVGFDVVPSDCLAVHLKRRLPGATRLVLAFQGGAGLSRGTATTMTENIHRGGMIRRNGVLTAVPAAWRTCPIDFGAGTVTAVTLPWGDVSTAWYSTGIPNIEVLVAAGRLQRAAMRTTRYLGGLLATGPLQRFLKDRIQKGPPGPSKEARERGVSRLWGEAVSQNGDRVVSRLRTPEGYTLTAMTALAAVDHVLSGKAPAGFQTPGKAFGADFVLEFAGVERFDD